MRTYLDVLQREIEAQPLLGAQPLRTVYFGGGTPSLISPVQLGRILEALATKFGMARDAELTMEADPGRFSCPIGALCAWHAKCHMLLRNPHGATNLDGRPGLVAKSG